MTTSNFPATKAARHGRITDLIRDRAIRSQTERGALLQAEGLQTTQATLSRDLVTLLAAGYHVEEAHLVDLFPQTYHMETILHLAR